MTEHDTGLWAAYILRDNYARLVVSHILPCFKTLLAAVVYHVISFASYCVENSHLATRPSDYDVYPAIISASVFDLCSKHPTFGNTYQLVREVNKFGVWAMIVGISRGATRSLIQIIIRISGARDIRKPNTTDMRIENERCTVTSIRQSRLDGHSSPRLLSVFSWCEPNIGY